MREMRTYSEALQVEGVPNDTAARTFDTLRGFVASITLSDVCWLILFNLLAWQIYFQREIGGVFTYIDEISSLVVVVATVSVLIKHRRRGTGESRGIALPFVLLVLALGIGLLSNVVSGVAVRTSAIATDLFTFCKFPLVVLCCTTLPSRRNHSGALWRLLVLEVRIVILIMAFFAVMTLLLHGARFHMSYDIRYGLYSFRFIFYHPEVVNLFTLGLIVVLLIDRPDGHRFFILVALAIMCSTLRSKAMGFVVIAALIIMMSRKGHVSSLVLLIGALACLYVSRGQISNYYDSGDSARSLLTEGGSVIADMFAPLGSGFATYGSAVTASVEGYSPLYYLFGFNQTWGLSPLSNMFISDTFWPTLTAQLGYVGAAFYTAGVALALWFVFQRMNRVDRGLAVLLPAIYLLICTTASSALFAPQWTYLMVVIYLGVRHVSAAEVRRGAGSCELVFRGERTADRPCVRSGQEERL